MPTVQDSRRCVHTERELLPSWQCFNCKGLLRENFQVLSVSQQSYVGSHIDMPHFALSLTYTLLFMPLACMHHELEQPLQHALICGCLYHTSAEQHDSRGEFETDVLHAQAVECKDANEMLLKHGPAKLRDAICTALPIYKVSRPSF